MAISVRPSVRPSESCLKLLSLIILNTNHHDEFRMTSGSIKQALREYSEHSEINQREREQSDFVIPSEPKILRLVSIEFIRVFYVNICLILPLP